MGSPRVGDIEFWDWFETHKITHYRIVHESDNVPHVMISVIKLVTSSLIRFYSCES